MGVIGKLLGGLFALIGGIVKGLLGVFGIGKSEFYLEADDDAVSPAPAAASAPAPAASAPVAAAPAPGVAPTPVVAAAAAPVSTPPAPVAPVKAKTPAGMTFAPEFINTAKGSVAKRRRPGPSLSPFMDMARSVGKSPSLG